jgi:hypothetical protein
MHISSSNVASAMKHAPTLVVEGIETMAMAASVTLLREIETGTFSADSGIHANGSSRSAC